MKLLTIFSPDMFNIFSKCVHCPDADKSKTKMTFLVVGLDNAGKSTAAKGLQVKTQFMRLLDRAKRQKSIYKIHMKSTIKLFVTRLSIDQSINQQTIQ